MSEGRSKAFPELYFGEAWIYYISKLLAFYLWERATDDPRTKEAMSPKEDSGECNLPSASQFEIKSLQAYRSWWWKRGMHAWYLILKFWWFRNDSGKQSFSQSQLWIDYFGHLWIGWILESENNFKSVLRVRWNRKIGRIGGLTPKIVKNLSGIKSENSTCKSVYTFSAI